MNQKPTKPKIAIHETPGSFSSLWITYCEQNDLNFKIVDCYSDNIIEQMEDCDILMWHHQQGLPIDAFLARNLFAALSEAGKTVFPDYQSSWHFDNKVAQKYLFEALKIPTPKNHVFYRKSELLQFGKNASYPIVFKLKGGSGSRNVKLIQDYYALKSAAKVAYGKGFRQYDAHGGIKEAVRRYRLGKYTLKHILKAIAHIYYPVKIERMAGREWGYVYLQEYIESDHDFRVIVIKDKAFAIKRYVRKNDFRASGSGHIEYSQSNFSQNLIKTSFELAKKINSGCIAFDFVYKQGKPVVLEISYGWNHKGYYSCPGYWTEDLNWHEGSFNPYGWMVENVLQEHSLKNATPIREENEFH